ncbi:MAG: hemolysin III family protein [Pseudomonadota bacterium]
MSYPYSPIETYADGAVHVVGISAAVTGIVLILVFAAGTLPAAELTAVSIYGALIILSFAASAAYHLNPFPGVRRVLRRIDHAAIYLKIAGTYTPFVVMVGSAFCYGLLAAIWAIAAGGAWLRLCGHQLSHATHTAIYLCLGWAAVLLIWPLASVLPIASLALMLAGGAAYTLGALFFLQEDQVFLNAIWHGFVLAGSSCFFLAICLAVFAPEAQGVLR